MIYSIRNLDTITFLEDRKNIGEVIVKYKKSLQENIDIVKEYTQYRIVFLVSAIVVNENNIDELTLLSNSYKDLVFCAEDFYTAKLMRENGLPMFLDRNAIATTFDMLVRYCELGVTDVYVGGQLGFSLDKVKYITEKYGVKVRVIPNLAQYSGGNGYIDIAHMDTINAFWIRPEDINMYEDLIDVIEFAGTDNAQEVFYSIYAIDHSFIGDLKNLIGGMTSLNNKSLPSEFTENRIDCDKKCLFDRCHKCFKFQELSKLIDEHSLTIESH